MFEATGTQVNMLYYASGSISTETGQLCCRSSSFCLSMRCVESYVGAKTRYLDDYVGILTSSTALWLELERCFLLVV